jgi:hypothetical protein
MIQDHENPERARTHTHKIHQDDDDDDNTWQLLRHQFRPFVICFFNIKDYSVSNGWASVYFDMEKNSIRGLYLNYPNICQVGLKITVG